MTLPWKDKTQYQVHVDTLEQAARACVDPISAASIRALTPAPYPEPARLHPVASESTDDIASGKRNLFTELKEGFRELASRPVDEPMQDTGNVEVDRLIGRLMSADPDFSDCTDAAAFIRRLVAAPVAVGDAKQAFATYWCRDIPQHLRANWEERSRKNLDTPNAPDRMQAAWEGWQAALASQAAPSAPDAAKGESA